MDCREVEELLPGYALSALAPEEEEMLEAHLDSCPWCPALLRDQLQVASVLSGAAEGAEIPLRVKADTLRAVAGRPARPAGQRRPPVELRHLALGAAAAVAILLLAAVIALSVRLTGQVDDLQDENDLLQTQVARLSQADDKLVDMVVEQRSLSYVMAVSDRQVMALQTAEGDDSRGVLMIAPHAGTGVLLTRGLKPSSEDHTYDVWLEKDGESVAVGHLVVDEWGWGHMPLWPSQPITLFQKVWVTMEPTEGDTSRVLWGNIATAAAR